MTEEELKHRHKLRVYRKRKFKHRDRFKPKAAGLLYHHRVKHYRENDYEFNQRKAPAETGYGIAYEHRPTSEVK